MAAERGKHIILEKPMALNLEDCDAIIEAAERNQVTLVVGHTHSFDSAILKMRSLASTGELGQLAMLSMWNFTDFLYRPRRSEELVTELGGGIIFNQLPHQIDMARFLAGAPVRSVRAHSVVLDRQRPTEGGCTAFLDFENGVAASLVYSGYDRFDSDEFYGWVGSTGRPKIPSHGSTRRALRENTVIETEAQLRSRRYGYGGDASFMVGEASYQPHFGALIATYELGDARPAPHGLTVYTDDGAREIRIPANENGRSNLVEEFYQAVVNGVMPLHDGKFARGTVDVTLAILKSSQERREVFLS
jgi:phthalate 4,5-cis-dihydrodiol dehydrogenase